MYPLHAREGDIGVHQWLDDRIYEMGRVLLEGIWSGE